MAAGDVTSPPGDGPASRPAHRPRSQTVENALRTGVLGDACAYGGKPRSPQHGAGGRRRGVVPTRCAGAPPAGPPTPTHPTASLRTTRALESAKNHALMEEEIMLRKESCSYATKSD